MSIYNPPPLRSFHIRLTQKCNLSCHHCYASSGKAFPLLEVDPRLVTRSIYDAVDLGASRVTFSGGEPFLHPEAAAWINLCNRLNSSAEIETNGLLVNQQLVDSIASPTHVLFSISIDGDVIRGTGMSKKALQSVMFLRNLTIPVQVQTTLLALNKSYVLDLIDILDSLSVRHRVIVDHCGLGRSNDMQVLALEEVQALMKRFESKEHLRFDLPPYVNSKAKGGACGWNTDRCEIMPDGSVTPCAAISFNDHKFIAGNIMDKSIKELWRESELFATIRNVTQLNFNGACSTCLQWDACYGSCRAVAVGRGAGLYGAYPICEEMRNSGVG